MLNGVAIAGKAGAGKNRFAAVLSFELIRRAQWPVEVAFADQLRQDVMERWGLTKADPGGRERLVNYSNEIRQDDPLYWVKILARRCDSLRVYGCMPIITDLRYPNEYEWAVDAGFVTVRVDATLGDRYAALAARGEDSAFAESEHVSEVGLDDAEFDIRFVNYHGPVMPGRPALSWRAVDVADVLLGDVELVA